MTPDEPRPPGTLRIERVGFDHPDALRLVEEVQQVYLERYGSPDRSTVDPLMFDPPNGLFLLGYLGDDPVATAAWRRHDVAGLGLGTTAEIKRMYVTARAQRAGHARTMLAELERSAAEQGIEAMILETGVRQPEAIALYRSSGYRRVEDFGHYSGDALSRSFGKPLCPPVCPPVCPSG